MLSAAFGACTERACGVEGVAPEGARRADDGKVLAEYIWLGQSGVDMQSRTIVLDRKPSGVQDLPVAEIDGSTYGAAPAESCEVYLQPRRVFPDPLRGGDHILVLCDTYVPPLLDAAEALHHLKPHATNRRAACAAVVGQAQDAAPEFAVVQGYSLADGPADPHQVAPYCSSSTSCGSLPVAVPAHALGGAPRGRPTGGLQRLGREVAELHMRACLGAGLSVTSSCSQGPLLWCYKLGPCDALALGDQLSASRYLLQRAAEAKELQLVYPSPCAPGDWGGGACQVAFSTKAMRCPSGGMAAIHDQLSRLQRGHVQHVLGYAGGGLQRLLSGQHGVEGFHRAMHFSVGIGNKSAALLLPTSTLLNRKGPIVDQRVPADADPYMVALLLTCTSCDIACPVELVPQAACALAPYHHQAQQQQQQQQLPLLPGAWAASSSRQRRHSSDRPTDSCASYSASDVDLLGSCGRASGATTAVSQDLLISALDKLDQFAPNTPPMVAGGVSCTEEDACSEVCSDASSPPLGAACLEASLGCFRGADQEMFYE